MHLSSDQCRAARGLLNWTQEQLAKNANVSRATVADFEASARQPMNNNLRSIADSMFVAGVEFIPEDGNKGSGVRFRQRKLEYINSIRIDLFNRIALIRMRYAGEDFLCSISLNAVDDYNGDNFRTESEYNQAISSMLHIILAVVERHASIKIPDGKLLVTYDMLSGFAE